MTLNIKDAFPVDIPQDENWCLDSENLKSFRSNYDFKFSRANLLSSKLAELHKEIRDINLPSSATPAMESYHLGQDVSSFKHFESLFSLAMKKPNQAEGAKKAKRIRNQSDSMELSSDDENVLRSAAQHASKAIAPYHNLLPGSNHSNCSNQSSCFEWKSENSR